MQSTACGISHKIWSTLVLRSTLANSRERNSAVHPSHTKDDTQKSTNRPFTQPGSVEVRRETPRAPGRPEAVVPNQAPLSAGAWVSPGRHHPHSKGGGLGADFTAPSGF